jgi:hypothetical protein
VRVECAYIRLYKGPAKSRSGLGRSIVTMVRPAAWVPIENLVWLVAASAGPMQQCCIPALVGQDHGANRASNDAAVSMVPPIIRTAGFPQYGWKVGVSGSAFPHVAQVKPAPGIRCATRRFASTLRALRGHQLVPRSVSGRWTR